MHTFLIIRLILATTTFYINVSIASIEYMEELYNPITKNSIVLMSSKSKCHEQTNIQECDDLLRIAKKYQPSMIFETSDEKKSLNFFLKNACQNNNIITYSIDSRNKLKSLCNFFVKFINDKLSLNNVENISKDENIRLIICKLIGDIVCHIHAVRMDITEYELNLVRNSVESNKDFKESPLTLQNKYFIIALKDSMEKLESYLHDIEFYVETCIDDYKTPDEYGEELKNHAIKDILIEHEGFVVFEPKGLCNTFEKIWDHMTFCSLLKKVHTNLEKKLLFVSGNNKKNMMRLSSCLRRCGYNSNNFWINWATMNKSEVEKELSTNYGIDIDDFFKYSKLS